LLGCGKAGRQKDTEKRILGQDLLDNHDIKKYLEEQGLTADSHRQILGQALPRELVFILF